MSACYVAAGHVTFLARRVKTVRGGSLRGCDATHARQSASTDTLQYTCFAAPGVLELGCRGDAESGRRLRVLSK